jgi:hypothetical protein
MGHRFASSVVYLHAQVLLGQSVVCCSSRGALVSMCRCDVFPSDHDLPYYTWAGVAGSPAPSRPHPVLPPVLPPVHAPWLGRAGRPPARRPAVRPTDRPTNRPVRPTVRPTGRPYLFMYLFIYCRQHYRASLPLFPSQRLQIGAATLCLRCIYGVLHPPPMAHASLIKSHTVDSRLGCLNPKMVFWFPTYGFEPKWALPPIAMVLNTTWEDIFS